MNEEVENFSSLKLVFGKCNYWIFDENEGWVSLDSGIAANFNGETKKLSGSLFWKNLSSRIFQVDNFKYDSIASIQYEKIINKFKINFNPLKFYEFIIYSAAIHRKVNIKNIFEVPLSNQLSIISQHEEDLKSFGWNLDFYNLLLKDGWNNNYCWQLWCNLVQKNSYVFECLIYIFVHEMMHLIWDHNKRMIESEDTYNWNVAADFAINQNLSFPEPVRNQLITRFNEKFWPKAEYSFIKYLYKNEEIILPKNIKNDLLDYNLYIKNRDSIKMNSLLNFNFNDEIKNKNADFYYEIFKENMPADSNSGIGGGSMSAEMEGFEHFFTKSPFGLSEDGDNDMPGSDGNADGKVEETFEKQLQQIEIDKIFKESFENSEEVKEEGSNSKSEIPCSIPLREKMEKLKKKVVNNQWKNEFKKFILRYMNEKEKDITMTRSSRKRPGIFPGMKREIGLDVIFIIDTSGSIGRDDYKLFINEIININKLCDLEKCRIIQCHTSVSDDARKFSLKKINSIEFKETGGTRMRSALDVLLNERNRKPVVIFTDGYIDWFAQEEFPFKVLLFLTCKENANDIRKRGFQVVCPKE